MRTPLLSFLTDFENALLADDPSPDGGSWQTSRSVNYNQGLARLDLSVRLGDRIIERGHVILQGYELADGTPCLKAFLGWKSAGEQRVCSYFPKPDTSWRSEARKAAAEWMGGPPTSLSEVETDASHLAEHHAATG